MSLEALWDAALVRPLTDTDKVAILSDWHMGNGGPNDDFKKNAASSSRPLKVTTNPGAGHWSSTATSRSTSGPVPKRSAGRGPRFSPSSTA